MPNWRCPRVTLDLRAGPECGHLAACYNPMGGVVSGSASSVPLAGWITY